MDRAASVVRTGNVSWWISCYMLPFFFVGEFSPFTNLVDLVRIRVSCGHILYVEIRLRRAGTKKVHETGSK